MCLSRLCSVVPTPPFAGLALQGPYITLIVCGGKRYTYDGEVLSPITRRMALEGAVQVWNRKQLLQIMGDNQACPTWMALMGYERMTDAQINEVRRCGSCGAVFGQVFVVTSLVVVAPHRCRLRPCLPHWSLRCFPCCVP